MIVKIAEKITDWLIRCEVIKEPDKELYIYATHSAMLNILPIALSVLLGFLFRVPLNGLLIILPFAFVRKFSGGFHAKKEVVCLVCSSLLLLLCVLTSKYINSSWIMFTFSGVSAISLIIFSPIENENRPLCGEERVDYKRITAFIAGGFFAINLLLFLLHLDKPSISVSIGIILPACLQIPCIVKRILCKNDQK